MPKESQPVERAGTGCVNDVDSSIFNQIIFFFVVVQMASIKGADEFQPSDAISILTALAVRRPAAIVVMLVDVHHSQSIDVGVLININNKSIMQSKETW
jgi:hypothetical protein